MSEQNIDPSQFLKTNEEKPPYGQTKEEYDKQKAIVKLIGRIQEGKPKAAYVSEAQAEQQNTPERNRALSYLTQQLESGKPYSEVKAEMAKLGMASEISDILQQMDAKTQTEQKPTA